MSRYPRGSQAQGTPHVSPRCFSRSENNLASFLGRGRSLPSCPLSVRNGTSDLLEVYL